MVDEYQDTDELQYELVNAADKQTQMCQSISLSAIRSRVFTHFAAQMSAYLNKTKTENYRKTVDLIGLPHSKLSAPYAIHSDSLITFSIT